MMEAPTPEPAAAEAVPDDGDWGAAEPDPPEPAVPASSTHDEELNTAPPPAAALAILHAETAPGSSEIEVGGEVLIEVDDDDLEPEEEDASQGLANGIDASDLADELSERKTIESFKRPDPFGGPAHQRGPSTAEFEAARLRGTANSAHPAQGKNSGSHSLVVLNLLIKLEEKWGLEFKEVEGLEDAVLKDVGSLLLEHTWIEDDRRMRTAIEVILTQLNADAFPLGGDWVNMADEKLRSKFIEQVRKVDIGASKNLMSSYSSFMAKVRARQRTGQSG